MKVSVSPAKREAAATRSGIATAREMLAPLSESDRLIGLTGGQYSLIDVLEALLEMTGPAEVVVATWTAGVRDAEMAKRLDVQGAITRLRLVVDRSFPTRQPQYVDRVRELFGEQAIRVTNIHAKFLVVGPFLVRTSMNLNRNRRIELVEIDRDSDLVAWWLDQVVEPLWQDMPPGINPGYRAVKRQFDAEWGTIDAPDDVREDLLDWTELTKTIGGWDA